MRDTRTRKLFLSKNVDELLAINSKIFLVRKITINQSLVKVPENK